MRLHPQSPPRRWRHVPGPPAGWGDDRNQRGAGAGQPDAARRRGPHRGGRRCARSFIPPSRRAARCGPARWRYCSMRRAPGAAPSVRCPAAGRVVLVSRTQPQAAEWEAAISVGAQHVMTLPAQDHDLVAELSDAAESCSRRRPPRRGGRGDRGSRRSRRVAVRDRIGVHRDGRPADRCRPVGRRHRPGAGYRGGARSPLARPGVAGRSAEPCLAARGATALTAESVCCRAPAPGAISMPHPWAP